MHNSIMFHALVTLHKVFSAHLPPTPPKRYKIDESCSERSNLHLNRTNTLPIS